MAHDAPSASIKHHDQDDAQPRSFGAEGAARAERRPIGELASQLLARELLERLTAGPEIVYLFWPTIMGYPRIVTHLSLLPRPLGREEAITNLGVLIALPHGRTPGEGEGEGFWELYLATRNDPDRGNDVPDGHLAALMRQHGVGTIYTRDRDFRRGNATR